MTKKYIIITSINEKTKAILEFEKKRDWHLIVVGDYKSKIIEDGKNLTFLSLEKQSKLGFKIVDKLPLNHYARKNIGYLYAIREGADIIYDTDDDNIPYPNWGINIFECEDLIRSNNTFINIYSYFSNKMIWPRGFPLYQINQKNDYQIDKVDPIKIGVWQGLCDGEPDVDAIYRLVFNNKLTFDHKKPVALPVGKYCPFNSQNTFSTKDAFPFLYLPSTVSFRFTDILRGYIAQRLMWEQDLYLGFTRATVNQERNPHDLMKDFKSEIDCYLSVEEIVKLLETVNLSSNSLENLLKVYEYLIDNKMLKPEELPLCNAWIHDLKTINCNPK